ncbi:SfnB family sulfur acquisition oxidoreductase [Bradyrhizobium sp. DASA03120]|uniref:SfnB family sulfur acquisition oxidoreductase n=1 Tax=Bradyrhizobium sp. SMVTL-02 TaxID=3395917 RepID=UPI003F7112BB
MTILVERADRALPGPEFQVAPKAQLIRSDAEAIDTAHKVAAELALEAAARDRERRLPLTELDRFSSSGLWGVTVPKAYGGAGVSFVTVAEVVKIISAADPSVGQIPQSHLRVLDLLRLTGSEEQKHFWFGKVLQGYRFGNAVSEAKSKHTGIFETTIIPDGDAYHINGQKFYATGALFAHYIAIAGADDLGRAHIAIAPRDADGLSVVDDWSSFGQRTTASGSVVMRNLRVPASAVLPAYAAYQFPSANGPFAQLVHAAIDAGIAKGALADTVAFVRQYARPWIDSGQNHAYEDQFTISQIGDLSVKMHAAEALLDRAGRTLDFAAAEPTDKIVDEASIAVAIAKAATTEIAILAANKLHELGGTRSTLAQYNLDRHWRNARTHTLHDPVRWKYFHIGNYVLNGVSPPRHPWN